MQVLGRTAATGQTHLPTGSETRAGLTRLIAAAGGHVGRCQVPLEAGGGDAGRVDTPDPDIDQTDPSPSNDTCGAAARKGRTGHTFTIATYTGSVCSARIR